MLFLLSLCAIAGPADPGRTQTRVYSAPFVLAAGLDVDETGLRHRLSELRYERVAEAPARPGAYRESGGTFQIYRRGHEAHDGWVPPQTLEVRTDGGRISTVSAVDGSPPAAWLEPVVLLESLGEARARSIPVEIDGLPPHVYLPLLALEDQRFYDHVGLDAIGIGRAVVANTRARETTQGGSTVTQQLVKNRDLKPRRTLDRKVSEAVRAVAMDAAWDKDVILETYLNTVYYGHHEGLALYGLGNAAWVYYGKSAEDLTLAEAATLAAIVQGPNGLHPVRHPDAARIRRDAALTRMAELGWASEAEVAVAKAAPLGVTLRSPTPEPGAPLRSLVKDRVHERTGRLDDGLGVVVWTTIDPHLQETASREAKEHATRLGASIAIVSLDAWDGSILAYASYPDDSFDRAGEALRQPGSAIKPLVLLEALERCGDEAPLHLATQVSDAPWTLNREGTVPWTPTNYDGRHHGIVDVRDAFVYSYNVPFGRIGAHCGFDAVADRMTRAGLTVPAGSPPSIVLGAVEVTPLALAGAYTTFAAEGLAREPWLLRRLEAPSGMPLGRERPHSQRVASATSAWLVHEAMEDAVARGTGRAARLDGMTVAGKTGTSSNARDAWFAGDCNGVVTVVWVGRDDNEPLAGTGGSLAAPVFRDVMEVAAESGRLGPTEPAGLVRWPVRDGLVVPEQKAERTELFRRGTAPPRKLLWRQHAALVE